MSNKNKNLFGVVFSTDPNYRYEKAPEQETPTLSAGKQKLRVWLDKKQRGGKEVSLVTGFVGTKEDLEALGKTLKTKCGTGGNAKDGEIIIQGNHRDKVVSMLVALGYTDTKAAGG